MGAEKYSVSEDIEDAMKIPTDEEVQFYLEEMQKMNSHMIDMQRELNRALMESRRVQEKLKQNEELKIALEASERAGKARREFMSRMSHDMRTPMNVILGLASMTMDEADNPDAVRENMAHIRSASDFMLGLINDLLDMEKIEEKGVTLKSEPYSYNKFAWEMKTMFQAQCDAKNITLIAKEASSNPVVMTDKLRLKQIFFNIISNAVKYTPPGGSISVGARNVKVNDEGEKISAEYYVSDTGIGMSEEFQKHLFEPFVQEDNTVSSELTGSGLGLSITKSLVDNMGGRIRIESVKGKGTTVVVALPFDLVEKDKSLIVDKSSRKSIQGTTKKNEKFEELQGKYILLVEDHPLNAQIARKMLEKEKMNVLHAENGKIAVEMFKATPIGSLDAVLMDIRMPEMSGIEAAKAIRKLDRSDAETIPIIALSANAYEKDIQECLNAGMNGHLAKPIVPSTLYAALKSAFTAKPVRK